MFKVVCCSEREIRKSKVHKIWTFEIMYKSLISVWLKQMLRISRSYRLWLVFQRDGAEKNLGASQLLGVHFDQPVFRRLHVHTGRLHGRSVHRCGGVKSPRFPSGPALRILIRIFKVEVSLQAVRFEDLTLCIVRSGWLWGHLPAKAQVVL